MQLNGLIFDWIPDQVGDDALSSFPPLPPSFPRRRESSIILPNEKQLPLHTSK
jgi:hypothetical protein